LDLKLNVDRKKAEVLAEASLAGKPGSELTAAIKQLGQSKSLFAGLASSDAAVDLMLHFTLADSIRQALAPAIDEGIRQGVAKEKDEAKRKQAQQFLEAIKPTLNAGEFDAGFRLSGPTGDNLYTILGGVRLRDGTAIEKQVRSLVKNLPKAEQSLIKLDAETVGKTHIHRIDAQKAFDANARQTLGDNPLYVAIGADAAWLSGGPNGLEALKTALSPRPQEAPQFHLGISMARLAPTIARSHKGNEKQVTDAADKAFAGADREKDRVSITMEGGQNLKARIVVQAPVIRFLTALPKNAEKPPEEK
jgi:hypothetical protein